MSLPATLSPPRKAVVLLSGGLDSTLAARIVRDQGIELHAIHFTSPFCTCSHKGPGNGNGCRSAAQEVAVGMGIPIRTVSKGEEYLEIVKRPRHGRGSAMNPCIDCRIWTPRQAKALMEAEGAAFVFTGEVLGQRPMSQTKPSLRYVEKHSGLAGYILRPLCAKHLPETIPEQQGLVDRERLLDIHGRGRRDQIALAKVFGITEYPAPAGGCLLTDKGFSRRLKDLFDHGTDCTESEVQLLKFGRHFRLNRQAKLIVGRTENDNESALQYHNPARDVLLDVRDYPSPVGVLQGEPDKNTLLLAAAVCVGYSRAPKLSPVDVVVRRPAGEEVIQAIAVPPDEVRKLMI